MRRKPQEIDFEEEAAKETIETGRRPGSAAKSSLLPRPTPTARCHRRRLCSATNFQTGSAGTSAAAGSGG